MTLAERIALRRSGPGLSNAIWLTPSSSNAIWLTHSSSTIFSFQLLLVSYSLASRGSGGQSPPVLAFSYRVLG